jgi:transcriptional regulator with XRE-family HTH domain
MQFVVATTMDKILLRCAMQKKRARKANAHLAHMQALTHMLILKLAKEPNFPKNLQINEKSFYICHILTSQISYIVNKFGDRVRQLREQQNLLQRQVATHLNIDTPMLSKIERGERKAKREQVLALAKIYKANQKELLTLWLADKVYEVVHDEAEALDALKVAEAEIDYNKGKQ